MRATGFASALSVALIVFAITLGASIPSGSVATAWAQPTPTPTLPNLFGTPTPTPSSSPTPRPGDDDDGTDDPDEDRERPDRDRRDEPGKGRKPDRGNDGPASPFAPRIPGAYNTEKLMGIAARLRSLGWSEDEIIRRVYPPFIIAGYAGWVDTWGAPRSGPGPVVRTHEGQDVFCDYGSPVLATEAGVIEFAEGGLGGRVARLHRPDGTYWYYAHLADWNTEEFVSGSTVGPGDVIGYCGTSGNAEFTPPHVHFGWYSVGGLVALDPMQILIRWLRAAEVHAAALVEEVTGQRVRKIGTLITQRRFGDSFGPDRSVLPNPGHSLWAAGASPANGAFAVAQVALQEALSRALPQGVLTGEREDPGAITSTGGGAGALVEGSMFADVLARWSWDESPP
ncbi:MAG TPA: M23 family metallopeptidase [Actinomycetota bacterium]|nr:M23 family metallopeptidase [Actinomycetota bacterium]